MIKIKIKEQLKKQNRSKYWFVKEMGTDYQAISRLMNNETSAIHFDTIEKICTILNCDISDIIVIEK